MSDDEDMVRWQEVLDLVMAGRDDLPCPFCQRGAVKLTRTGPVTRLECPACRKFVEGSLQQD